MPPARPARPAPGHLISYTHALCPYAQRVAVLLLEKRVPTTRCPIDLAAKPRWFREVNPRGLVPCVEHSGGVVVESLDILRWVDASFGEPLAPPASQGRVDALLGGPCEAVVGAGLRVAAGTDGRHWGLGTRPSASQKEAFLRAVGDLAAALEASGGPYLAGPAVSLADCALVPFLERFDLALRGVAGWAWDEEDGAARRLAQYLRDVRARPAFRAAAPDDQLMLAALREHMSLDFFDYESVPDLALHPHWDGGRVG